MKTTIEINYERCKQCGLCIHFCPKHVFDTREDGSPISTREADCIACMQCEKRCPDFAIEVKKVNE